METSLDRTDQISAAVQKTPHRVSLQDIKAKIARVDYFTLDQQIKYVGARLDVVTVCVICMGNGFIFVGKSAPADPDNYDAEVGRVHARDDAIRQIWPMEGYLLRDKLAAADGV